MAPRMDLTWDSKGMKKRCTEGHTEKLEIDGLTLRWRSCCTSESSVSFIQLNRKEAYYIQMIKEMGLLHTGEQGARVYSQKLDQRVTSAGEQSSGCEYLREEIMVDIFNTHY